MDEFVSLFFMFTQNRPNALHLFQMKLPIWVEGVPKMLYNIICGKVVGQNVTLMCYIIGALSLRCRPIVFSSTHSDDRPKKGKADYTGIPVCLFLDLKKKLRR